MTDTMDEKTLTALKQSIAKWKRNAEAKEPENYSTGWRDCALCILYFQNGCSGCPVRNFTDEAGCRKTPYDAAWAAFEGWRIGYGTQAAALAAARAEVAFLESLLPPEARHD